MKVIILFALISMAVAASVHTGSSTQTRSQDDQGNYSFSYEENHKEGGSHRKETRDARSGKIVGSYGYKDEFGNNRLVHYEADQSGYRASISSNEQGVVAKAPASVNVAVPDGVAYAPVHENTVSSNNN